MDNNKPVGLVLNESLAALEKTGGPVWDQICHHGHSIMAHATTYSMGGSAVELKKALLAFASAGDGIPDQTKDLAVAIAAARTLESVLK